MVKLLEEKTVLSFEEKMLEELKKDDTGIFSDAHQVLEPRAVAENVQKFLEKHFVGCFDDGIIAKDLTRTLSRRAMADILVEDGDGIEYCVDVKTHNLGTDFNMPNLSSIDRLSKYYMEDGNRHYFLVLLVEYEVGNQGVIFHKVKLFPIEHLKWDCLQIGALGKGQVQIRKASDIRIDRNQTRKNWLEIFYKKVDEFYAKEIVKANKRKEYMRKRGEEHLKQFNES